MNCSHAWEFYSCGVDGDGLRGRGPQRANFICKRCGERWRMQTLPHIPVRPDLSVPPYLIMGVERRKSDRRKNR